MVAKALQCSLAPLLGDLRCGLPPEHDDSRLERSARLQVFAQPLSGLEAHFALGADHPVQHRVVVRNPLVRPRVIGHQELRAGGGNGLEAGFVELKGRRPDDQVVKAERGHVFEDAEHAGVIGRSIRGRLEELVLDPGRVQMSAEPLAKLPEQGAELDGMRGESDTDRAIRNVLCGGGRAGKSDGPGQDNARQKCSSQPVSFSLECCS